MILCSASVKGGVGKTTLAINLTIGLARRKRDVLLIDADELGTALEFSEVRTAKHPDHPTYTAVALYGAAIRTQVRQMRRRYDDIVIDVGGRDSGSLRAALTVTQLVVVPTAPRSFDLWGLDQTTELIQEAREVNDRLVAFAVLNGADAAGNDNEEAETIIGDLKGIKLLSARLGRRKAYSNAAAEGLSVLEYVDPGNREGSRRACEEFTALLNLIAGA